MVHCHSQEESSCIVEMKPVSSHRKVVVTQKEIAQRPQILVAGWQTEQQHFSFSMNLCKNTL